MKRCNSCGHVFNDSSWLCSKCAYHPQFLNNYLAFSPSLSEENSGFEVGYFAKLAPLEANNFWFCSRNRIINWGIKKYFPKAQKFLEIGCGTGFVLSNIESRFSEFDIYGSEIFTQGLKFASSRLSEKVSLFQMDARQIPYDNEFDVIGAFDVLEHIEEDQIVLSEMYRSTVKGGGIILTVPQHPWLWSQADDFACHVRRYSSKELRRKVEKAGFSILKITSFVSLLLPLMMMSRLQISKKKKDYDVFTELTIDKRLNSILEKIMKMEYRFIDNSISLPFGGSLLLVAQK